MVGAVVLLKIKGFFLENKKDFSRDFGIYFQENLNSYFQDSDNKIRHLKISSEPLENAFSDAIYCLVKSFGNVFFVLKKGFLFFKRF